MCSVVNARCDRGRLCKRCVGRKTTCSHKAQDGLLFRSYVVPGGPIRKGFASVGVLEEDDSSDEECVRCQRRKLKLQQRAALSYVAAYAAAKNDGNCACVTC
jgi:hypothetical protein